jgi:Helicase conserved C-terminal domain
LGFCVSVEHARFMARVFQASGVPAVAVWADSPDDERAAALKDLAARRINGLFSVDLFNEGVDIPAVDTLLLLRPTDSPTLFLQQLGRGLRRLAGKTFCTVLDFVGQHRRFRALLGGSRKDLELDDIYAGRKTFSDLRADAGLFVHPPGSREGVLRPACGRLLHVDDLVRIEAYRELLTESRPPELDAQSARARALTRMLAASVTDRALEKTTSLADGCALLWAHPQVRAELIDLLEVLAKRVDHVHHPLVTHPDVPLVVHARYSRVEILAAFGIGDHARVAPWQTGVYWARDAKADLFAFTLVKRQGSSRRRPDTATMRLAAS